MQADRVLGVFTDGDLRRALDRAADLRRTRMDEVMTRQAKTVHADMLAAEAVLLDGDASHHLAPRRRCR